MVIFDDLSKNLSLYWRNHKRCMATIAVSPYQNWTAQLHRNNASPCWLMNKSSCRHPSKSNGRTNTRLQTVKYSKDQSLLVTHILLYSSSALFCMRVCVWSVAKKWNPHFIISLSFTRCVVNCFSKLKSDKHSYITNLSYLAPFSHLKMCITLYAPQVRFPHTYWTVMAILSSTWPLPTV